MCFARGGGAEMHQMRAALRPLSVLCASAVNTYDPIFSIEN